MKISKGTRRERERERERERDREVHRPNRKLQCSNGKGNNKPKVSNLAMSLDCVDSLMVESQNHISDVKTDERRRKIEGK